MKTKPTDEQADAAKDYKGRARPAHIEGQRVGEARGRAAERADLAELIFRLWCDGDTAAQDAGWDEEDFNVFSEARAWLDEQEQREGNTKETPTDDET